MTVPGKGGRPRKWRSDTDRVRAYRARQRGEAEPATFEAALAGGDELARAIELNRKLQANLAAASDASTELADEQRAERRRHQVTQRKLERARADLDGCRTTVESLGEALRDAHDALGAALAENGVLHRQLALATQPTPPPGLNRAARRRAAKGNRGTGR